MMLTALNIKHYVAMNTQFTPDTPSTITHCSHFRVRLMKIFAHVCLQLSSKPTRCKNAHLSSETQINVLTFQSPPRSIVAVYEHLFFSVYFSQIIRAKDPLSLQCRTQTRPFTTSFSVT